MKFAGVLVAAWALIAGASRAQEAPPKLPPELAATRVLYAGFAGGEREKAFLELLRAWFATVDAIDLRKLDVAAAAPYDVVVADWQARYVDKKFDGKRGPRFTLPEGFSKPLIAVSSLAAEILSYQSKLDWL